jgi:hypothetical protein
MKKSLFCLLSLVIAAFAVFVVSPVNVEAQATISPSITVISPTKGGMYKAGDIVGIKWVSSNIPPGARIGISYILDSEEYGNGIDANYLTASSTEFYWFIRSSDIIHGFLKAGKIYKVKVYAYKDGKILASSTSGNMEFLPLGPVELKAYTLSTREDRAGGFDQFGPGGKPNWNWQIDFKYPATTTIQNILIFRNNVDEKWSTNGLYMGRKTFPIVVYKYGQKVNSKYGDLNIPIVAGVTTLNLYGQSGLENFDDATLVVYYGDGRSVNTQLSAYNPSVPPATSTSTSLTLRPTLTLDASSPLSSTFAVNSKGEYSGATLLAFDIKATNSPLYVQWIYVNLNTASSTQGSSGKIKKAYLYQGQKLLSTVNVDQVGNNYANFRLNASSRLEGGLLIPANTAIPLIVKVDIADIGSGPGMTVNASINYWNVRYWDVKSNSDTPVGSVIGSSMRFVNSNGVFADSASTTISSRIVSNNVIIGYTGEFTFAINNTRNSEIYFTKDPNYLLQFGTTSAPTQIITPEIFVSPSSLAGDRSLYYLVPAGSRRVVTIPFTIKNTGGTTGYKTVKVIGINYVDTSVSPADRIINYDLSRLSTSVVIDGTSTSTKPFISVLAPQGGKTYQFGTPIFLNWTAGGTAIDYYYALLENTAIKNFGVVVTENLSSATTSASFYFSKNILNTFLANSGSLIESQLKDGYYIRIVGIKRGIFRNTAVVNGTSGTFSVSTSESAKGITVRNAQASLNSPLISGNVAVAYPVNFNFTMDNNSNDAVYVSTDPKYVTRIEYNSQTPSDVRFTNISASLPTSIAGDNSKTFAIPAGSSRSFNVSAVLRNYSGVTEQKVVKVFGIQYLKNQNSQSYDMVREGLEGLRVYPMMDGVATTTVATTTGPSTGNSTSTINSGIRAGSLIASNVSARLGSPIYRNNEVFAYNYTMSITLSNTSDVPVYMRNKNDGTDIYAYLNPGSASVRYSRELSPALLSGDTDESFVIPAGSSRVITYQGTISYSGSPTSVTYSITGLRYGISRTIFDKTLDVGLGGLKINPRMGITSVTSPTVSVSPVYSPTPTYSSTPRPSVTVTPVPSSYYSPSPTPYYSPTPTPTSTYIPSPTPTSSVSPAYSPTPTPTVSTSPVYTPTPTPTPTYSATPTPYYSPTPTSTYSPVSSPSPSTSSSPRPSTSPVTGNFGESNQASVWLSILSIIFGKK